MFFNNTIHWINLFIWHKYCNKSQLYCEDSVCSGCSATCMLLEDSQWYIFIKKGHPLSIRQLAEDVFQKVYLNLRTKLYTNMSTVFWLGVTLLMAFFICSNQNSSLERSALSGLTLSRLTRSGWPNTCICL